MGLRVECTHQLLVDEKYKPSVRLEDDQTHQLSAQNHSGLVDLGWARGDIEQIGGVINGISLSQPGSTYTLSRQGVELRVVSVRPHTNGLV